MTRCKTNLVAVAALAAVLSTGASSPPASAQAYPACAPGFYYWAGYCYPYDDSYLAPSYYPYYSAPFFFPSVGIGFAFHDHFHDHVHNGFHNSFQGSFHGGAPMMSGGFHGGAHR
jgi:hypothetical protein